MCVSARGPAQHEGGGGAPFLESQCRDFEGEVCGHKTESKQHIKKQLKNSKILSIFFVLPVG